MIFTLTQTWSSAHFYHQKDWPQSENTKAFGKCFSPFGHGHDYKIEVSYSLISIQSLTKEIQNQRKILGEIRELLDHKHLNHEIKEFAEQIPTTENIALFCFSLLKEKSPEVAITKLVVFERPDLWVELIP